MRQRTIHCHGPLPRTIAFELVQADASQRAEIAESLGNVQGQQQIHGSFEIQASELVRPLAFPNLAGRGISPGPYHGNNILRETVKRHHRFPFRFTDAG